MKRIILVLLTVVTVIALIRVGRHLASLGPGPEPGLDLDGPARAANVAYGRFVLWELHPDDTVRIVELITQVNATDSQARIDGPMLRSGDKVLTLKIIGGQMVDQTNHQAVDGKRTYLSTQYLINVSGNQFGYDMRVDHPPHLHINNEERSISIGVDPKPYHQEIIAVAVPVKARLIRIYDYQPYRHVRLEEWDIFYYDVSKIQAHVSIHLTYRPDRDAPSLDRVAVEAVR